MDELEIFRTWVAYYAHFTSEKYDFIKQQGHVKATPESMIKRPEYKMYISGTLKFKTVRDLLEVLLSGIDHKRVASPLHISEALEQMIHHPEITTAWKKKISSLVFTFAVDIDIITDTKMSKSELLLSQRGKLPGLLTLWEKREINTESLIILDKKYSLFQLWDNQLKDNFIWEKHKFFIGKYSSFINTSDKDFSYQFDRFNRVVLKKQN